MSWRNMPDRELVVVTLRGLSPISETFINTIRDNNVLHLMKLLGILLNTNQDDSKRKD